MSLVLETNVLIRQRARLRFAEAGDAMSSHKVVMSNASFATSWILHNTVCITILTSKSLGVCYCITHNFTFRTEEFKNVFHNILFNHQDLFQTAWRQRLDLLKEWPHSRWSSCDLRRSCWHGYLVTLGTRAQPCTLWGCGASLPWCPPALWCHWTISGRWGQGLGCPGPAQHGWLWTVDNPGGEGKIDPLDKKDLWFCLH